MGKKKYKQKLKKSTEQESAPVSSIRKAGKGNDNSYWPWIFLALTITAIFFSPMFSNGFTNWDDEAYVVNNPLLSGPDWKGIFSENVVGNYHPLTVISLALNYQLSGTNPSSYLFLNFLLHLLNTGLVFYFIWLISGKKKYVALFSALVFGIHPMHVESVAWISERKDVLYTFFFLLSMIRYWQYLEKGRKTSFWICFLFFILSLASKPAAIILPLVLYLLDYWKGRRFERKMILEKIPFFIASVIFAYITVSFQSENAVAGLDIYPIWMRPLFACYVSMIYLFKFFIPYPLSAFYPYPDPDHLGWAMLISPVVIAAFLYWIWRMRKNKLVVFSTGFFFINLLLVLQIVSIGYAIVAERYTYVPYIGLSFGIGMWLHHYQVKTNSFTRWGLASVVLIAFAVLCFIQVKTWKNSATLWSPVIKLHPHEAVPRANRAQYYYQLTRDPQSLLSRDSLYELAISDCNEALKSDPNFAKAYLTKALICQESNKYEDARVNADSLIKLTTDDDPDNSSGYAIRGLAYMQLRVPQKALDDLSKRLSVYPDDEASLNNRGAVLYNFFQRYADALADFNKALSINTKGIYYLNRSRCYNMLGDKEKAKADLQMALQLNEPVSDEYRRSFGL